MTGAASWIWLEGYGTVHGRYSEYGHRRVFQESGTLINTLLFATDAGDGICKRISQGNNTPVRARSRFAPTPAR
ncbi:hypothetical protein [Streptomyces sp. NPDC058812]|uniref:hypothetical protein n=1 Tax=unclassified Streptomyces TaxID=2593676 RepID=UPI0036AFF74C